jgi:hypothetical protein
VKHHASPDFRDAYRKLPGRIQLVADKCFELLEASPRHPSLHFKPVAAYWSIRIGRRHRALAARDGTDLVWFWIGSHADYDHLVRSRR